MCLYVCMLIICKQYAWPKLQLLVQRTKIAYIKNAVVCVCVCVRATVCVLIFLRFAFCIWNAYFMVATCRHPLPPNARPVAFSPPFAFYFSFFVFPFLFCENNPRVLHLVNVHGASCNCNLFWTQATLTILTLTQQEKIITAQNSSMIKYYFYTFWLDKKALNVF